jgi:hypothetical protein
MADETMTGAKTDVQVNNDAVLAADKKKKLIKTIVTVVLIVIAGYVIYKYIWKK